MREQKRGQNPQLTSYEKFYVTLQRERFEQTFSYGQFEQVYVNFYQIATRNIADAPKSLVAIYDDGWQSEVVRVVLSRVWEFLGGDKIQNQLVSQMLFFMLCNYANLGVERLKATLVKVLKIDDTDFERIGDIINSYSKDEVQNILMVQLQKEFELILTNQSNKSWLSRLWSGIINIFSRKKKN